MPEGVPSNTSKILLDRRALAAIVDRDVELLSAASFAHDAGFPRIFALISDRDRGLDFKIRRRNRVEPLLHYSLTAQRHILPTHSTCVIRMIILLSKQNYG